MSELDPVPLVHLGLRHVEQRLMKALAAAGLDDLTVAQARLCLRLTDDGVRLRDLAAAAHLPRQDAAALVDQLEGAGYVVRRPEPGDARVVLVALAARGRLAHTVARRVERRIAREWQVHLGPSSYAHLVDSLTLLREVTEPGA